MNKQETKEKIKVMQAFVDGKAIQYWDSFRNKWVDDEGEPIWNWRTSEFRIKPEMKIRPYTFEEMCEAVKKHGSWTWDKETKDAWSILYFDNIGVKWHDGDSSTYEIFATMYWLDDNSPCGIMEEE